MAPFWNLLKDAHKAHGKLANRDSVTRNHCEQGKIVVDIDGDDAIIGRQVFITICMRGLFMETLYPFKEGMKETADK